MTNITLSIPEIHCMACEALIKLSLKKIAGIRSASVNVWRKTATIDFDDTITSKDDIQQQIEKYTGYKVFLIIR